MPSPPRNKPLIRPELTGKPKVNSPLIRPYFFGGCFGEGTLNSHEASMAGNYRELHLKDPQAPSLMMEKLRIFFFQRIPRDTPQECHNGILFVISGTEFTGNKQHISTAPTFFLVSTVNFGQMYADLVIEPTPLTPQEFSSKFLSLQQDVGQMAPQNTAVQTFKMPEH